MTKVPIACATHAGGRKAFDIDERADDGHCAEIHDSQNQERCHQAGAAIVVVETKTKAVLPSGARVARYGAAKHKVFNATGKVPRFQASEWKAPAIRIMTAAATGTARASASCCITRDVTTSPNA